ncbi:type II toxin-antitoxin system Phd/YefM family antitoxin [Candidatus Poriferisocius sp.]|uniref:type II toxin-antitoxin system Phd/YefM family antitoxin n=1 Tax=Candidatus Poriferisocius sp. TaxID=3101276 RepID=UPI003B013574
MFEAASRELRNQTRALLDRVADGERITITVNGRPVAELTPVAERPQWMARDRFVRDVLMHQADAALADDLAALAGETTDELRVIRV